MVTRRLWWAAAGALLVVAGCDSPQVTTDGGPDGSDACEGLTLCTTAGTSCDGDSLVTCAANADGCLVETTAACGADQSCGGSPAACVDDVDPCDAIPAAERCTAEGRTCDGDTLTICAANTDGCLVIEETDCAASAGGACDDSGTMPMCVLPIDPCDGIAGACTTPGTSCDGENLVTCAPNAFGCLVETSADCSTRAGGTCDDTATAECTFTGDPCDGITQCAAAGVACDGPELVACAEDAFGCLVETRTDCTDTMFGFCDADGTAVCSTAATDPCMGETECGTEETRACSGDDSGIDACAPNAFGCFVAETTACDTGDVCSDASGTAICVDICSLVDVCPSATYCDGNDVVTCAADTNGCLVESSRAACASGACGGEGVCYGTCTTPAPGVIDCASGTVTGNTAGGTSAIVNYDCTTWNYPSPEQVWVFRNAGPRTEVSIVSTRGAASGDYDLYALAADDGSVACDSDTLECLDFSDTSDPTEEVTFVAEADGLAYIVYDRFGSSGETTEYTLEITCAPVVCNDGVINGDEECEDGNTTANDGCSDTCQIEDAWDCTDAIPTTCTFVCGNGTTNSSAGEDCDDGNAVAADGCSAICREELGWNCTGTPSTCTFLCGNGTRDSSASEQCDDGNAVAGDGCSAACQTESGFTCIGAGAGSCIATASNAVCASPAPLGTGVTGANLRAGGPRPTGTNCGTSVGPVLYYSVDIAANSAVTVTGTPTATSWDLTLRSLADCSGSCIRSVDAVAAGSADSIELYNTTGTAVTQLIAVGADSSSTLGTFDLTVATRSLAANAGCDSATPVPAPTTLTAQDVAGGGPRPSPSGCGGGTGFRTLYYSVTVPPGTRVDVDVTPSIDLVLFTQNACGDTSCTSTADDPETATFVNAGTTPITRIVGVRPWGTDTSGLFDIEVTHSPLPYSVAPITAACVTTGTWTTLTRSSSVNDATTPITALPFAFTYFGEAVTHFSTNDNGIAQLWSSSTGTPSNAWTNAAFPNTSTPNGTVAAFWDDIYLGTAYEHRSQIVGAAGSQVLVIEWSDGLAGSAGSPLTFQAHFHEGTNVIEYHYCSVGTGDRASGDEATIGIENLAGTDGVTISHNTGGAVATGGGYRLTPN